MCCCEAITDFNSLNSTYRDKRFRKISIKLFKYRIAKASWNTCDAAFDYTSGGFLFFRPQQTISRNKEPMELTIKGRHDPLIVPRAVVVVEAMCALTIADSLLLNMTAQMENRIFVLIRKNSLLPSGSSATKLIRLRILMMT